jgi:hypothetical protein
MRTELSDCEWDSCADCGQGDHSLIAIKLR